MPGNETFLVGAVAPLEAERQELSKKGKVPEKTIALFGLDKLGRLDGPAKPGMPVFDASKHPCVVFNMGGLVLNLISDKDMVQEMWTTKAKYFSKHILTKQLFDPMFGHSFGVYPTNDLWRTERKAVSHMFFKDKLRNMVEVLKEHIGLQYRKWISEIEKNGEHCIDIASEFERINAHKLNHIMFGEDLNDDKFDFLYYDNVADTFTERKVSMRECISNMSVQCINRLKKQLMNPVTGIAFMLFQTDVSIGEFERVVRENSRRLRAQVNKYVQDRKNGVTKSKMDGADLLSHFLEH